MASIINLPVESCFRKTPVQREEKAFLYESFLVLVSGNVQKQMLVVLSHITNCPFPIKREKNSRVWIPSPQTVL